MGCLCSVMLTHGDEFLCTEADTSCCLAKNTEVLETQSLIPISNNWGQLYFHVLGGCQTPFFYSSSNIQRMTRLRLFHTQVHVIFLSCARVVYTSMEQFSFVYHDDISQHSTFLEDDSL